MKKIKIIIFSLIIITGVLGIIFISIGGRKSIKSLTITKNTLLANSSDYPFDKNYTVSANVKELYIEANTIEFKIIENSSYSNIEIAANNFLREADLQYSVEGNVLNIKSLATPPIGYGHKLKNPNIILKIPSGMKFDIISINAKASDIECKNISVHKLKINNNIGHLVLNVIDNSFISVQNKVGEVNIKTKDIDKYGYSIKNNMGEVVVGNKSYEGIQNEATSDNDSMNVKVQNNLGSVSIL